MLFVITQKSFSFPSKISDSVRFCGYQDEKGMSLSLKEHVTMSYESHTHTPTHMRAHIHTMRNTFKIW